MERSLVKVLLNGEFRAKREIPVALFDLEYLIFRGNKYLKTYNKSVK